MTREGRKDWKGTQTLKGNNKHSFGKRTSLPDSKAPSWPSGKPCWPSTAWISQDDLPQLANAVFSWLAKIFLGRGEGLMIPIKNENCQLGHPRSLTNSLQCPLSHWGASDSRSLMWNNFSTANGWHFLNDPNIWCWSLWLKPATQLGMREQTGSAGCFRSVFKEIMLLKIHNLILELNRLAQDVGLSTVESHSS